MKRSGGRIVLAVSLLALVVAAALSVLYGSRQVSFDEVYRILTRQSENTIEVAVILGRIPRTVLGITAGAALAVSGVLMQSVTRNPIADPGVLGINSGAAFAVAAGIAVFRIQTAWQYIGLALAGAAVTAVLVYLIASLGQGGITPIKLALAGAAVSATLSSMVSALILPNARAMDEFRFWQVGSISGAEWSGIGVLLPVILAAFLLALGLMPALNALALGDEMAVGLGIHPQAVRGLAALAGVILCGATTALAGPIGFVGLMIPHIMRLVYGPEIRKILPMSAVGGAVLLLLSDVAGRVIGRPGEINAGIITAILGAPVFIAIVRKAKVRAL